jgi:chemotaxis methyl-accepting protein methylase
MEQDFFSYHRPLVAQRIAERWTQLGYHNAESYYEHLASDTEETASLARMLLIRYSRFFRHPLQFQLMRDVLLPPLVAETDRGIFKVWSAACAGGEEAYSLAIILDEVTRSCEAPRQTAVFATDIAEDALAEGRRALYAEEKMEEVTLKRLKTYFITETGNFRVCDTLRRQVSFSRHDMLDIRTFAPPESIFGGFDLILCRNFLMYLTADAFNRVFDKLFKALNPGGILMLGEAETVPEGYLTRFTRLYDFGGLYRKDQMR